MKIIENNVIVMFRHGDYIIEICKEKCQGIWGYDSYLQKEGCGIKMSMFGMDTDSCSLEEYIALVEVNLPHHIEIYEREGYGA